MLAACAGGTEWNLFRCGVETSSTTLLRINKQAPLIWVIFMAKNFQMEKNTIAKHDAIFLREEILEYLLASPVKTHFSFLAQKIL